MQPRILYQILTEPVLPPELQPEQVTESRWHQPLSEPVRRGGLITAVVAATTIVGPSFVPNPVPPPSVGGWHGQISQPTLRKGPTGTAQAASVAFIGSDAATDARWIAPLSEPVRVKRAVEYPAFSFAYFTAAAAEVVTVDKYYNWFSEPVRRRGFPAYDQQALAFTPQSIFGSGDVAVASTNTIVPFQRTMLYPAVQGPVPLNTAAAEVVTVDKYYNWFSEPVRVRLGLPFYDQQALAFVPQPISGTADVAFASTNTIVPYLRVLLYPAVQEPVPLNAAAAEVVTVDKYYNWLAEPVRGRGYKVFQQVEPSFVGSDTATDARWFVSLSDPGRRKAAIPPDGLSWSYFTSAVEVVTVDKYYNWLSEPVRLPRSLAACQRPYLCFVKAAPFAETVSIDRWMQQLSQPTLRLVSVAGQPFAAWSAFTPQPIVVLAREWIIKARRRGRR